MRGASSQSCSPIAVLSAFVSSAPDEPRAMSAVSMKKMPVKKRPVVRAARVSEDDIRAEYDFSTARRNPYAVRFKEGVTVVALDADVAASFPDAVAVNDALRALVRSTKRPAKKRSTKRRTA